MTKVHSSSTKKMNGGEESRGSTAFDEVPSDIQLMKR